MTTLTAIILILVAFIVLVVVIGSVLELGTKRVELTNNSVGQSDNGRNWRNGQVDNRKNK